MPKVLIVEDTNDIAFALQALIELEGYEAAVARTAAEGYALTLEICPDLIVMDIALSDENGLDLTRRIRASSDIIQPVIICVSSYTSGIEAEVLTAGCDEVFSKTTFMMSYQEILPRYLDKTDRAQA